MFFAVSKNHPVAPWLGIPCSNFAKLVAVLGLDFVVSHQPSNARRSKPYRFYEVGFLDTEAEAGYARLTIPDGE